MVNCAQAVSNEQKRQAPKPEPSHERTGALKVLPWTMFKSLNNMYFLRISYFILVSVPILAAFRSTSLGIYFGSLSLTSRLGYFSSLLLSFAHMIYQGYCPQIIKRFESPNDLYREMLEIKALKSKYLIEDKGFEFDIKHCCKGFTEANQKNWVARLICALLYGAGIALAGWVILENSLAILGIRNLSK